MPLPDSCPRSELPQTAEHQRLAEHAARTADWKNWGPYVSDRAWGTVREDYTPEGDAWRAVPFNHAAAHAYRWGEDGLAGFCNRYQNLCLAVALWNERDPILKERLFGLSGPLGNHGEDVKEYYWHLDGTPTHSYMKMLYRYPQAEFPYAALAAENGRRTRRDPEFELVDALADSFREHRFFDVTVEYAKAAGEDILCLISVVNRGPDAAPIHILPHVWMRNTWSWGYDRSRPELRAAGPATVRVEDRHLGERWWHAESDCPGGEGGAAGLLFTDNTTNRRRLHGTDNVDRYVKDGIEDAVVRGRAEAVNPEQRGTKAAAHFRTVLAPGATMTVRVRLAPESQPSPFADFNAIFDQRRREADEFYAAVQSPHLTDDERTVQRQALAGLLWNKQFYHYGVELWLDGDPAGPPPPEVRKDGRNRDWRQFYALDVLAIPDKWEYPWFAAWDHAFHCLPISMIDPDFAKRQLILLLREWYMHPNGQLPAYEWSFSDVNPPVHAWAALRVYKISRNLTGVADTDFLERVFHKLLLNFTWWVNRKDRSGDNIFEGGFLGLDNIGVFNRSDPLPGGGRLEQADGTAWMAMYCLNMLAIALELARVRPPYEDVATKFFEHFIYIADAINHPRGREEGLWDAEDGFFYDEAHLPDGRHLRLRVRSLVGLIPLLAVETYEPDLAEKLPHFAARVRWFLKYRPWLVEMIAPLATPGQEGRRLMAMVNRERLERVLTRMLDPEEFLSPYGLRSLSKAHAAAPFTLTMDGHPFSVGYEPAEAQSDLFGGNSNWRGPIWMPLNFLMIEALQKYHHYYGDTLTVEMPRGSGRRVTLDEVAKDLSLRLMGLFLRGPDGRRPVFGTCDLFQQDPLWRDLVPFNEYFHGDTGAGLGASHQTGWTALVAKLMQQRGTCRG
jgi:hypothetical protein